MNYTGFDKKEFWVGFYLTVITLSSKDLSKSALGNILWISNLFLGRIYD